MVYHPNARLKSLIASLAFGAILATFAALGYGPISTSKHPHPSPQHFTRDGANISRLTKRWEPCDWAAAERAVDEGPLSGLDRACGIPLNAGKALDCMLTGTDATLWASKWTNPDDLEVYGWTDLSREEDEPYPTYPTEGLGLDQVFEDLEISIDEHDWVELHISHARASYDPQTRVEYPRTGASYANVFNIKHGFLVANMNASPQGMNANRASWSPPEPPLLPLPPIQSWADVLFLAMKTYAEFEHGNLDGLGNVEHVVRLNVVNHETQAILGHVIGQQFLTHDKEEEMWPGFEFPIREPQAKAALGSPNGKGVAWLLGSHKAEFGNKYIDRVNVFNCPDTTGWMRGTQWCLYFHIADGLPLDPR